MRKSKVFVSLALAGAMITTSVLGSVAPKAEAAVATVKVATVLDTDYKNQEISNGNGLAKDGSDATSRMYNLFYMTEDGKTGTKGPGNVILNKLGNVKCGEIYGVRFFTNANPEVENEAKFTGVIQFASSGRAMRDSKNAVMYSETPQSDGIKYTLQSYSRLINYLTGDIIYLNSSDVDGVEGGTTIKAKTGSALKGYKYEGFTVDADGKFVKKLSQADVEQKLKEGYEIANDYWTTPNFSTKKFPTWTDEKTNKVSKYAVLMGDDGSLTYQFKSPIGDDTNTNFQANLVVYNASNQRAGIGVTAVQLLGKDGKVIYTDTRMGDLNNVTGTKFTKSSATLGAGETVYVPAELVAKSYSEKYTNNTKPIDDTIKYVYKTGAGIEYSVADTSVAKIVYGKEDVQKKVIKKELNADGVTYSDVWTGTYEFVRTNWLPSVQGLKAGTTQLIATPYTVGVDGKRVYATNKAAKINIYVKSAPTSVSVSNKKKSLYVGDTLKMKMKIAPASAVCSSYTFSSSSKKVASVAPDGTIKAVKPGKTTIKVTTYNGKSTSFKLTVKAPAKTSLKSVKVSGKSYTVKWKKSSLKSITGYKVSISSTSKFAKKTTKTFTVKGKKKTSKKFKISASLAKKISASGTAYVRIQTYTKVGTKTYNSSASKAKKVSVK